MKYRKRILFNKFIAANSYRSGENIVTVSHAGHILLRAFEQQNDGFLE